MNPAFKIMFWSSNLTVWLALIIAYMVLTSTRLLKKKGYTPEYINFLKRSQSIRILSVMVLFPVLEVISALIVRQLTGPLVGVEQAGYIVLVLFFLVIPLKYLDETLNRLWLKRLALDTGSKVVVDMKYQTLHLIFRPSWEVILGIACLAYGIFVLHVEYWMIYLHLILPWFMYFTARGTRYQTRPYLKDNYLWLFVFNVLNFSVIMVFFSLFLFRQYHALVPWMILSGIALIVALAGKLAYYLVQYPRFRKELSGVHEASKPPRFRTIALMIILGIVTLGSGYILGNASSHGVDVGNVSQKYIVHFDGERKDTLLLISTERIELYDTNYRFLLNGGSLEEGNLETLANQEADALEFHLKMDLTVTKQSADFIVGLCQYRNVEINSLIKFRYNHNVITELIDY
jgi:hypothetical protein